MTNGKHLATLVLKGQKGVPYARRGTHYFKAFCPSSTKGILDVSKTPLSTCGHLWIQNKCFGPNAHYNVAGVLKKDLPEVPTIDCSLSRLAASMVLRMFMYCK